MAGELADKKILVVDDERDILAAMSATLEDLGAEVVCIHCELGQDFPRSLHGPILGANIHF